MDLQLGGSFPTALFCRQRFDIGAALQSRSYVSVHWVAILTWTNFSAHALASR
jgi:hypothetical protein